MAKTELSIKDIKHIFGIQFFNLVLLTKKVQTYIYKETEDNLQDLTLAKQCRIEFIAADDSVLFNLYHQLPNVGRNKSEITLILLNNGSSFKYYSTENQNNYIFNVNDNKITFKEFINKTSVNTEPLKTLKSFMRDLSFLNYKKYLNSQKYTITFTDNKFNI